MLENIFINELLDSRFLFDFFKSLQKLLIFIFRYKITAKDFTDNGGGSLLSKFNSSPSLVVTSIFSDFAYLPWFFKSRPKNFFEIPRNRLNYIKWLIETVGVKSEAELTSRHYLDNGGVSLLRLIKKNGSQNPPIINSLKSENSEEDITKRRSRGYWVHLYFSYRHLSILHNFGSVSLIPFFK